MEKDEWKVLAKTLKAVYTGNYLPDIESIKTWYYLLKDLPTEDVAKAIQEYCLTNHFPPTVADIRELATKDNTIQDWSIGWQSVLKAISQYGYTQEKQALDSLDYITRETVERIGFKNICCSEKVEIERASFRVIYESIIKEEKRKYQIGIEKLPSKLIEG